MHWSLALVCNIDKIFDQMVLMKQLYINEMNNINSSNNNQSNININMNINTNTNSGNIMNLNVDKNIDTSMDMDTNVKTRTDINIDTKIDSISNTIDINMDANANSDIETKNEFNINNKIDSNMNSKDTISIDTNMHTNIETNTNKLSQDSDKSKTSINKMTNNTASVGVPRRSRRQISPNSFIRDNFKAYVDKHVLDVTQLPAILLLDSAGCHRAQEITKCIRKCLEIYILHNPDVNKNDTTYIGVNNDCIDSNCHESLNTSNNTNTNNNIDTSDWTNFTIDATILPAISADVEQQVLNSSRITFLLQFLLTISYLAEFL